MIKRQKGFTLVEILIALSIWGLAGTVITGSIFQIMHNTDQNSNHMSAVLQVQNADRRISNDALTAQVVNTDDLTGDEYLILGWIDGGNGDEYEITYYYDDMPDSTMKRLMRTVTVNGGSAETSHVASFIDPDPGKSNCQFSDGVLVTTITATIGGEVSGESETRTNRVFIRSN